MYSSHVSIHHMIYHTNPRAIESCIESTQPSRNQKKITTEHQVPVDHPPSPSDQEANEPVHKNTASKAEPNHAGLHEHEPQPVLQVRLKRLFVDKYERFILSICSENSNKFARHAPLHRDGTTKQVDTNRQEETHRWSEDESGTTTRNKQNMQHVNLVQLSASRRQRVITGRPRDVPYFRHQIGSCRLGYPRPRQRQTRIARHSAT